MRFFTPSAFMCFSDAPFEPPLINKSSVTNMFPFKIAEIAVRCAGACSNCYIGMIGWRRLGKHRCDQDEFASNDITIIGWLHGVGLEIGRGGEPTFHVSTCKD